MRGEANIQSRTIFRQTSWMTGLLVLFCTLLCHAQSIHSDKCPVKNVSTDLSSTSRQLDDHELMIIPVVVHVVYNDEQENISDEQIFSQLDAINLDFRKLNEDANLTVSDFQSLAADVAIEFELADTDPQGKPTDGITRTATEHGAFANNDLHSADLGGVDAWDTDKYLNIWVANLASGIIGYASQPDSEEEYDGIAIHFKNFGTKGTVEEPYHLGRTLTHEAGHWLGLNHLWGDGGCESDDGIEDTPNQQQSSTGCELEQVSCGSLDMVQNFMDFSEDECMSLFTAGQAELMRNTLMTFRSGMYTTQAILSASFQARPNEIHLRKYNENMIINLSQIAMQGELIIYDISGHMLFRQWIEEVYKDIYLTLESNVSGHMKVVQYRTEQKVFSAKFI